jgi:hypothetical protein
VSEAEDEGEDEDELEKKAAKEDREDREDREASYNEEDKGRGKKRKRWMDSSVPTRLGNYSMFEHRRRVNTVTSRSCLRLVVGNYIYRYGLRTFS